MPSCETKGNTADALPGGHPGTVQHTPKHHLGRAPAEPGKGTGGRAKNQSFGSLSPRLPCPGHSRRPVDVGSPSGSPSANPPSRVFRRVAWVCPVQAGPRPLSRDCGCRVGLPYPGRDPFLIQELRLTWVCLVQAGTRSLSGSHAFAAWVCLVQAGTRSLSRNCG